MLQSYTRSQLESKTRNELWVICTTLSLPRRRSSADCINDILATQPQRVADAEVTLTTEQQDELKRQANQMGYQDGLAGKPRQLIDDISYLSGYLRGQRDAWQPPAEVEYDGSDIESGSQCKDGKCELPTTMPKFDLLHQAAELCQALADQISELTDDLEWSKNTHDLDTFLVVHDDLKRLNRIWSKADARYWRRLEALQVGQELVAA